MTRTREDGRGCRAAKACKKAFVHLDQFEGEILLFHLAERAFAINEGLILLRKSRGPS